jgi:hypothetical protein
MNIQTIENSDGLKTGVFIPIEDWNNMKEKYPNIEEENYVVPDWQKKQLNKRLKKIKEFPESVRPIEEFFAELNK